MTAPLHVATAYGPNLKDYEQGAMKAFAVETRIVKNAETLMRLKSLKLSWQISTNVLAIVMVRRQSNSI